MTRRRATERRRMLEAIAHDLCAHYPALRLDEEGGTAHVRGSFRVGHEGRTLARYLVDITLPEEYPREQPIVREVGGQIPWTAERHVYTNGIACLFYPADYWLRGFDRMRFVEFLDGPVRNYFLFQACLSASVPWIHGEQAHNTEGAIDYFAEQLGTNAAATLRCIEWLANHHATAYTPCPCGSGLNVRSCHTRILRVQRLVPQRIFQAEAFLLHRRKSRTFEGP